MVLLIRVSPTHAEPTNPVSKKTYRNPVLEKYNIADPDVLKVGKKYYLYATTHTRGYDVFVSDDLVHWENKGLAFDDPRHGDWAPDVFHNERDGQFYLYYTDNNPEGDSFSTKKQIGVAVAANPLGPFVDKAVLARGCIDAHLFQDDDGKFYLYYVNLIGGFEICVQPMADPLTKRGEARGVIRPTEPWEKTSGEVTEGPFMLKHDGVYYLMFSGTGANSPNYGIGYATSKSPMGPFTKYAGNPIVKRTDKIFGPGHHCVVEGPGRKLWLIYHQKRTDDISWPRFLAIDPIWFDKDGTLHCKISKETDEPAP
ncbi:MAG: glycoside hydrolase family 43 protein [Verrucomicrobiota bacterium]